MADDRPDYSFSPGPPPEASRYLRAKALRPAFSWLDVEPEEHAVAFSVAKATKLDVLTAIREEVQRALDQGIPLEQFQRDLRPRLEKLGWWGARETIGKDGTRRTIQLGSPRRLRTIYDANIRSARAAGQWERIQRTKRAMPYLLYGLGPSERHRPHHESKAGLVLPVDDPFWATWMPPNGWGCKCWVRQITRREAETRGIEEAPAIETREWINARTGEVKQIPVGIDPGWERNPGLMRQEAVSKLLEDKLVATDPAVRKAALRDIADSWHVRRITEGGPGRAPVGLLPARVSAGLPDGPRIVHWTRASAGHVIDEKPEQDRRPAVRALADLEDATRALVITAPEYQTAHFQFRSEGRWYHAIVWFDDGARIRSVFPTDAHYFDRILSKTPQAAEIRLKGG